MSEEIKAEHGAAVTWQPLSHTIENVRAMLDDVEEAAHGVAFALVYEDGEAGRVEARAAALSLIVGLREVRRELDGCGRGAHDVAAELLTRCGGRGESEEPTDG